MFDDINLLPEELRRKEEKERAGRQEKLNGEELSFPVFPEKKSSSLILPKAEKIKGKPITEEVLPKPKKEEKPVGPRLTFLEKIKKLFKREKKVKEAKIVKEEKVKESIQAPEAPIIKEAVEPKEEKKVEKPAPPVSFSSGDKLTAPSDSLEVNLVPVGHDFLPLAKIYAILIWAVIINLLIVGILDGLIILSDYQIRLKAELQDQKIVEQLKKIELLQPKEKQAENILAEIKRVEDILKKHLYWTKFFSTLEKYTLDNVYYTNFAATSDGSVTLSAVTSDYQSVGKQLLAFEQSKDFIKSVKILSAAGSSGEGTETMMVNFNISLVLDPKIFLITANE